MLDEETVRRVHDALAAEGFRRRALMAGIAPGLVGSLARAKTRNEQLLQDLWNLNAITQCDGDTPMRSLLLNALKLSRRRGSASTRVFAAALRELAPLLPPSRRESIEALLQADTVPRGARSVARSRLAVVVALFVALGAGALVWRRFALLPHEQTSPSSGQGAAEPGAPSGLSSMSAPSVVVPQVASSSTPTAPTSRTTQSATSSRRPIPTSPGSASDAGAMVATKKVTLVVVALSGMRVEVKGGGALVSAVVREAGEPGVHDAVSFSLLPAEYAVTCVEEGRRTIQRTVSVNEESPNVVNTSCLGY